MLILEFGAAGGKRLVIFYSANKRARSFCGDGLRLKYGFIISSGKLMVRAEACGSIFATALSPVTSVNKAVPFLFNKWRNLRLILKHTEAASHPASTDYERRDFECGGFRRGCLFSPFRVSPIISPAVPVRPTCFEFDEVRVETKPSRRGKDHRREIKAEASQLLQSARRRRSQTCTEHGRRLAPCTQTPLGREREGRRAPGPRCR